jgi:hypothetical protein
MVPIIGLTIIAFSLLLVFTPMSSYLVNAFETQAASALVANTLRSILSAVFPLAGRGMYSTLEIGWGNSLLGFIALALCPGPIVVYIYMGENSGQGSLSRTEFTINWERRRVIELHALLALLNGNDWIRFMNKS